MGKRVSKKIFSVHPVPNLCEGEEGSGCGVRGIRRRRRRRGKGGRGEKRRCRSQGGRHRRGIHRVLQEHLQGLFGSTCIYAFQCRGGDRIQIDFVFAQKGTVRHDGQLLDKKI